MVYLNKISAAALFTTTLMSSTPFAHAMMERDDTIRTISTAQTVAGSTEAKKDESQKVVKKYPLSELEELYNILVLTGKTIRRSEAIGKSNPLHPDEEYETTEEDSTAEQSMMLEASRSDGNDSGERGAS